MAVRADTEESLPNIVVNQVLRQEGLAVASASEERKMRRTKETSPPGVLTISVVVPVHALEKLVGLESGEAKENLRRKEGVSWFERRQTFLQQTRRTGDCTY